MAMSRAERVNFTLAMISLAADSIALFVFASGVSSIPQILGYSLEDARAESASRAFNIFSGLIIAYGWLAVSWYLTRRVFVLRGDKPVAFVAPLFSRSRRIVFGVGLFLVPTIVSWGIVVFSDPHSPPSQSGGPPYHFFTVVGFILGTPLLGLAIWGCINLLMPIVHVEMLDEWM